MNWLSNNSWCFSVKLSKLCTERFSRIVRVVKVQTLDYMLSNKVNPWFVQQDYCCNLHFILKCTCLEWQTGFTTTSTKFFTNVTSVLFLICGGEQTSNSHEIILPVLGPWTVGSYSPPHRRSADYWMLQTAKGVLVSLAVK